MTVHASANIPLVGKGEMVEHVTIDLDLYGEVPGHEG